MSDSIFVETSTIDQYELNFGNDLSKELQDQLLKELPSYTKSPERIKKIKSKYPRREAFVVNRLWTDYKVS